MAREFNTTTSDQPFDKETISAVWEQAIPKAGHRPGEERLDHCGALIRKAHYGKTDDFGWEIDHAKPISEGGTDDLGNLQPLHWENNRHKGDNWPAWECKRTA